MQPRTYSVGRGRSDHQQERSRGLILHARISHDCTRFLNVHGQAVTWANGKVLSTIGTNGALTKHQAKPTSVKKTHTACLRSPRPEHLRRLYRTRQYHLLTSPCLGDVLSVPQATTKWNDILTGAPESQEVLALDTIGEGESGLAIAS